MECDRLSGRFYLHQAFSLCSSVQVCGCSLFLYIWFFVALSINALYRSLIKMFGVSKSNDDIDSESNLTIGTFRQNLCFQIKQFIMDANVKSELSF